MKMERKCVACRKKMHKSAFFRIVRTPAGEMLVDPEQKIEGRGFYLCPDLDCIEKAAVAGIVQEKSGITVNAGLFQSLKERLEGTGRSKAESLLGFAARSRKLVTGWMGVQTGCRNGNVHLIVIDPESGKTTLDKAATLSSRFGVPSLEYRGEIPFDKLLGKDNCRIAGVTDRHFALGILQSQ